MEGYINARVMVEAIKRAGNKPPREGIVTALESMRKVDFGGYMLSFSATNHTGSEIVELAIIGKDGRFMHGCFIILKRLQWRAQWKQLS